jgi:hypothetical protein
VRSIAALLLLALATSCAGRAPRVELRGSEAGGTAGVRVELRGAERDGFLRALAAARHALSCCSCILGTALVSSDDGDVAVTIYGDTGIRVTTASGSRLCESDELRAIVARALAASR